MAADQNVPHLTTDAIDELFTSTIEKLFDRKLGDLPAAPTETCVPIPPHAPCPVRLIPHLPRLFPVKYSRWPAIRVVIREGGWVPGPARSATPWPKWIIGVDRDSANECGELLHVAATCCWWLEIAGRFQRDVKRRMACPICGKRYKRVSQFRRHLRQCMETVGIETTLEPIELGRRHY